MTVSFPPTLVAPLRFGQVRLESNSSSNLHDFRINLNDGDRTSPEALALSPQDSTAFGPSLQQIFFQLKSGPAPSLTLNAAPGTSFYDASKALITLLQKAKNSSQQALWEMVVENLQGFWDHHRAQIKTGAEADLQGIESALIQLHHAVAP